VLANAPAVVGLWAAGALAFLGTAVQVLLHASR